jgi:hypothetical protein
MTLGFLLNDFAKLYFAQSIYPNYGSKAKEAQNLEAFPAALLVLQPPAAGLPISTFLYNHSQATPPHP